jgi:hypothetical protein
MSNELYAEPEEIVRAVFAILRCYEQTDQYDYDTLAALDLQLAFKEGQRKGQNMEKAPKVRNVSVAQLGLRVAEHAC